MLAPVGVQQLHRELSLALPGTSILLGGSQAYGEATAESDVDFYCICSFWQAWKVRKFLQLFKPLSTVAKAHVMVMPRFLYTLGWYYVYGVDVQGRIQQSGIRPKVIVRSAIKKSLYRYVRFAAGIREVNTNIDLAASAKQLAAAIVAVNGWDVSQPLFSTAYLLQKLSSINPGAHVIIKRCIDSGVSLSPLNSDAELILKFENLLKNTVAEFRPWWNGFSYIDYLLYNFIFLRREQTLFLVCSPDTLVVKGLFTIFSGGSAVDIYWRLRPYIFPVFISSL